VRMSRLLCVGRRLSIRSWSSEIVVSEGRGRERVDGRLSPGKDVKRTLIVDEAMVDCNQQCLVEGEPGSGGGNWELRKECQVIVRE
jgi:hypothetical protein